MVNKTLHTVLTTSAKQANHRAVIFWFCASLAVAGVCAIQVLQQAFSSEYVVQDDARQHVFWMWRLIDPALFPNDRIANYFQSVAPLGYSALYRLFASLGLDPLLTSKLLPAALALLTTAYCFALCLQLLPIPATAFIATVLFNQNFWMRDDLASASPRAFLNLFFLAFLYYLLRRSRVGCLGTIVLLGVFYPQYVFIAAGVLGLRLWQWQNGRLRWCQNPDDRWICLAGLAVAFLVMLPFALSSSEFGPTITAAAAKQLPEFLPNGRSRFFYADPGRYWLSGGRSGIQPPLDPPLLCLGLLLPVLFRIRDRLPLLKAVSQDVKLLVQLTVISLGMFFLAHALLFKLHLPSRYTQHSLRIVMAFAAAIVLTVLLDALFRWSAQRGRVQAMLTTGITGVTAAVLLLYPLTLKNFPKTTYVTGTAAPLYEYFSQQPKDSLIASLSEEASNLPTFARRSILVGSEYAIPYHVGYYQEFRQRVLELIQAQYSPDLSPVKQLIQHYGVTHWLLDRTAFEAAYVANNSWLRQYQPATANAATQLEQQVTPAIANTINTCQVFETPTFLVLEAACILQIP